MNRTDEMSGAATAESWTALRPAPLGELTDDLVAAAVARYALAAAECGGEDHDPGTLSSFGSFVD
jgi:hypothetical protein